MYVIFGASGKVGRSTVAALRREGREVRAIVRNPAQGEALWRLGCEVAIADLGDEVSVRRALEGAQAVQMLCPVPYGAADPAAEMRHTIATTARVLGDHPHLHVLALSDYGAEVADGIGIPMLYGEMEAKFKEIAPRLTLLRSAPHMQNWIRVLPHAMSNGVLATLYHPIDKRFPTVSAHDVGVVAAQLLLDEPAASGVRIVSVEAAQRYSAEDAAHALAEVCDRDVGAYALPREKWSTVLEQAGMNPNMADLVIETSDAQNNGWVDAAAGTERRFGPTGLRDVLAGLVASAGARW
ncbi:MAG: NmrA family NAD(P)-binding protein [Bordetella sp.]|uniref:NmrA family NAD(P)-binding protein n=1 Tax=Bordetella sp. TaxID=28081 RepID=UPI003F7B9A68